VAEYMILIFSDDTPVYTDEAWQDAAQAHGKFYEQVGDKIVNGRALQLPNTATTVRGDVVTDGPFVETKEVLGGYYIVNAKDLDEAIEIAKLCPAPAGGVEVRPIMDTSEM
jgi:hypothetical protein